MAFTSATLQSTVCSYLQQYDADFITNFPTIVAQAEDRILKAVNLPVFKKNADGAMTTSNRFLAAPSDMLSPYAMTLITTDGAYTPLLFREPSLIYEMWGGNTTGQPQYYSLYNNGTFLLGPTPDADYAVEFQYFYRPPSIMLAGTSWLGTNAENALLYATLVEAYNYQKGDELLAAQYEKSFLKALEDLIRFGEGLSERDNFTDNEVKIAVPR